MGVLGVLTPKTPPPLLDMPLLSDLLTFPNFYRHVMRDLKMARAAFPADQDLQIVTETLQLSQEALMFDGHELASQLVGRIHGTGSASMIDQARAMMEMGVLPPEAVPILSLLEAFEVHHEKRSKVSTWKRRFRNVLGEVGKTSGLLTTYKNPVLAEMQSGSSQICNFYWNLCTFPIIYLIYGEL